MALRLTFFALCAFFGTFALAADGDQTFEKLMIEVQNKTVFTQITGETHCPKHVVLEELPLTDYEKPGDRLIGILPSNEKGEAYKDHDNFTFEGNQIHYRPGLPLNSVQLLDRNLEFILGTVYTASRQQDKDGVLTSNYYANAFSYAMIARANFTRSYDSNTGTISYKFSGNGVPDVNCIFSKVD
jgi:hypothetical protein